MLAAGVGLVGAVAASPVCAQPASAAPVPRVKGPAVWLDMDQAEHDAAYDHIKYAPNLPQITGRYASNSVAVRARVGAPTRVAYGPTAIGSQRRPSGVPDFVWVQDADGNLMTMADQMRRAVAWVARNAASFGGDPDRIHVSGHSSGAHMAGLVLTTDWRKDFGLPADTVKGGLCCSGLFDLKPVRVSARSSYVKFTDEIEQAMSSQRRLELLNAPLILASGTLETPEFQRQTRDFAAAVRAAGKPVQLLVGEGYNHFEIIETMANPYGLLGRAVLDQMKLTGG